MSEDATPLAAASGEILKCPRCGQCRAYCPVFSELHDETSVARGRIALAKALLTGSAKADGDASRCMDECTLCLACVANCPSGVRIDSVVLAGRAELAQRLGISTVKRAVFHLLSKRRKLLPYAAFAAATLQEIAFARLPANSGLRLRFPVAGFGRQQVFPAVARHPLLSQLPEQAGTGNRGEVVYFVGCYDNYLDPQVGHAVVTVLTRNGYRVTLPRDQGCCAMPMLASGVRSVALELMRHNVDLLAATGCRRVVAACASCGSALKHLYQETFAAVGDHVYAEKAAALGERVRDLSQLLIDDGLRRPERELALRVTYHDPCHLVRGQGVRAQPRELLRSLPGVEFVEMNEADRCCGGAGSFSFVHYELARRINDRKVANVASSGAQIVATECPSCKLFLTDGLVRHGLPLQARQLAELLAMAYGPTDSRTS